MVNGALLLAVSMACVHVRVLLHVSVCVCTYVCCLCEDECASCVYVCV